MRDGQHADGPASPEAQLALLIRQHRVAAGLSQSQLAHRVGYTRQYVSRAEQVSRGLPSTDLVAAIDRELAADGVLIAAHADARRHRHSRRTDDGAGLRERGVSRADELERLHGVDRRGGPGQAEPGVRELLDRIGDELDVARGVDRRVLLRTAARAAEFAGVKPRDVV